MFEKLLTSTFAIFCWLTFFAGATAMSIFGIMLASTFELITQIKKRVKTETVG